MKLSAYDHVMLARDCKRPNIRDYIEELFTDFVELKGDRLGMEDASILGGIALFEGKPVTVIGHVKGHNLVENAAVNFGMPQPEGYRKALRLMKQAEKFHRPVITIVDTPGAYPGIEAESNGQSIAIANNLAKMSRLKTPIICVITGEGSSGGALALAVADRVYMLEHAVYNVLSPEGFATILWKDSKKCKDAAKVMGMTADELFKDGLIDGMLKETPEGVQVDKSITIAAFKEMLQRELSELCGLKTEELLKRRFEKYRRKGLDGRD